MKTSKCILIIILILIAWGASLLYVKNIYEFRLEHFEMYYVERFSSNYTNKIPNGLYFSKGFTCIWLKDREYADTLETFNHEWAHYTAGTEHYRR